MLQEFRNITEISSFPNPYNNKCTPYQKFNFNDLCYQKFLNELHQIFTAKIVVLGDVSVGKSSLVNR